MEGHQSGNKDLGNLSIKDLFFKYLRFLPVFLVSIAVFLLGAYLYLRYSTPIYRVGGTLIFKTEESSGGGRFDEIFTAKNVSDVQSEIEILKSKPLMKRVVDTAQLQTSYFAVGKIKTLNIYDGCPFRLKIFELTDSLSSFRMNFIFTSENEFRINKEKENYRFGDVFKNSFGIFSLIKLREGVGGKEFNVEWRPSSQQASIYAPMVRVAPKITGSNIYNIQIDYTNSSLGADIINTLMAQYKQASVEEKNVTINQRLVYILEQLGRIEQSLDTIEENRIKFINQYNLIDAEAQLANYFKIQTDADEKINDQRQQIVVIDLLEQYLKDAVNNFERVPSNLSVMDATLSSNIMTYNNLQLDRKRMLEQNIPETNPQVLEKTEEIEILRKSILESLSNQRAFYKSSIDDFYRRASTALAQQKEMPAKVQQLLEMDRLRDGKVALFKFLAEQREETAMQMAATVSNSRILEFAYPTSTPIKPNRKAIQLLAII
ncbi:MAG TPA: hypothetical protein VJ765_00725, partial [Chitinophagaceae bacterium]|nr:hypothetical protein [Chitinophagaceae bacterium]